MNTDEPFRAKVMAAAWFYDGEGSTTVSHGIARVAVVQNGDPYVLERFRQVFGVGKVYGPYPPRTPRQQIRYHYLASRFEHVQAIIAMMWLVCKNGHAMTLDNSRFSAIPEGKRRRCLLCSRGYHKTYQHEPRRRRLVAALLEAV